VKAPVEISSGIDRDHKQHDFTELPLLGKLRNEHITSDLAIWRMDHEENWDEHKATGYKRQRDQILVVNLDTRIGCSKANCPGARTM
jgi:hypothetical protein